MVNRYGKPEEVAYLVKFLISDEANFINNTIIRIDGGQKEAVKNCLRFINLA
ncbi:SDR family oxidoreductase [Coprobacillaceae bacterium CR2/5/TPMF4]|nr:SDR family oxidoreductase [Coprobacillaceae bacterium CR2/5/TPMF4]